MWPNGPPWDGPSGGDGSSSSRAVRSGSGWRSSMTVTRWWCGEFCAHHQRVTVMELLHPEPLLTALELEEPSPPLGPSQGGPFGHMCIPMHQCHSLLDSCFGH